ncbi:MAG: diacylglycerol kinase family protein [Bacteroidetes bacterium]|nr:diacylglycerol kinase family protein [Bacteroidota bacterium]
MNVALLVHGQKQKAIRKGGRIQELCDGVEIKIFASTGPNQGVQLCQAALDQGSDTLVFVGGDGWFNECINGLCQYYQAPGSSSLPLKSRIDWAFVKQIKVGFVPAGSGNDFVKSLEGPIGIASLCEQLQSDQGTDERSNKETQLRHIDLGYARFMDEHGAPKEQFFLNIADVGMGSQAVKRRETMPSWLGSMLRYYAAIASTIGSFRPIHCAITVDKDQWEGEVSNAVVANGRYFGHGLCVAPHASVTDGLLDVIVLPSFGLLDFAKQLFNLKKGRPLTHPGVRTFRGRHVDIRISRDVRSTSEYDPSQQADLEMDGDHVGMIPVRFECLSERLTIL